jgi:hydroxymethylpyrimidine kinase / phosphomethylpyrimidine kinase / thiamine-phosphate diphosphorylase
VNPPSILTIAGSDSGGGAGIQADLKAIMMQGCYGLSVVTALTAQNTRTVAAISAPEPDFVALQLKTVMDDFPIRAAKTGMLFSAPIIEAVADGLSGKTFPLVVDPVCVSQSGAELLQPEAVTALTKRILPLADLLTPNKPEAEFLTGVTIATRDDLERAAKILLDCGAKAVLIKGGHFEGAREEDVTDWLALPGRELEALTMPRVDTKNAHGTGCTLSAAIAANLGLGMGLLDAVRAAQSYLNLCLRAGYDLGLGDGPPNHLAPYLGLRAREAVLRELERVGDELLGMEGLAALVPEVRMNFALAAPYASKIEDVAAFSGRITCTRRGRLIIPGCAEFAASSHMAKVVLAAASVNPAVTSAVDIRYNARVLAALDAAGLRNVWFDRADEPQEVKEREGSTLEWGTRRALLDADDPASVDAVSDPGEKGKEPIIRLLGADASDVLGKLRKVLRNLS